MSTKLKRRAGTLLATVAAVTAVILAALPGVAEAQEAGPPEGPPRISRPAPEAPTNQMVVAPGDTLWTITQRHLEGHLGPDVTPQQVANEVERIFELNREWIGDNPDLILPGQELSLGAVSEPSGTVAEPELIVEAGPVAGAAVEQPAAAGRDVEQTKEPKQLPEALPTQEDASAQVAERSLPEPDNTQRRLLGIGVLALTLLLAILMLLRLSMRRNGAETEVRGTVQRYPDRYAPSSYDVFDEREGALEVEGAPRTALVGSTHPDRILGGSGTGAFAKGNVSDGVEIASAAGGRRKKIFRAQAAARKRLPRRKWHAADVYSPEVHSASRRALMRALRRTGSRTAAAIKCHTGVLVMGLALSLAILTVLPGMTKAQEMASVQDTRTANQNADATTSQFEPSDQLIVYPGDSLWSISQERLGPRASPKQIADEVGRTFELNRERIGDDPNLIFPGQELLVAQGLEPAADVSPTTGVATKMAGEPAAQEPAAQEPATAEQPTAADEEAVPDPAQDESAAENDESSYPLAYYREQRVPDMLTALISLGFFLGALAVAALAVAKLLERRRLLGEPYRSSSYEPLTGPKEEDNDGDHSAERGAPSPEAEPKTDSEAEPAPQGPAAAAAATRDIARRRRRQRAVLAARRQRRPRRGRYTGRGRYTER